MFRSQEIAHVIFYRKSTGVLQDVVKEDFGGLMVEKWWKSGNGGWMRM